MSDDGTNKWPEESSESGTTEDEFLDTVQLPQDHSGRSTSPETAQVDQKGKPAYHKLKWKRFRKNYNDQYLDVFNLTCEEGGREEQDLDPPASQHGAVIWSTEEKNQFFQALARYGRHNLPRIAGEIKSKSQIEVKDYLDSLRTAHINRQLFEKQTKNVAHAEIPAAVEIGCECERSLDQAADALAAFQEQYDVEAGQRQHGDDWVIDRHVASQLDAEADEAEDALVEAETDNHPQESPEHHLFYLTAWLKLSEKFFMNVSDQHWSDLAEEGQTPSITQDVVEIFHALVVSITQRILQVSIFMAKLRIRSISRPDYLASRILTSSDVITALDILKMPQDTWNFWTHLPRRNGSVVFSGTHNKNSKPMSSDEAEAILSVRRPRGHRRSTSVSTEGSTSVTSDAPESSDQVLSAAEESEMSITEDIETADQPVTPPSASQLDSSSSESELNDPVSSTARVNRRQRHVLLEEAQDEYMEKIDQKKSAQEENRLLQILGGLQSPPIKQEEDGDDVGIRPKTLRKDKQELRGWVCTYGAEWERFGTTVPPEEFLATARGRKRKADDFTDGD